jgi:hypothetical protein
MRVIVGCFVGLAALTSVAFGAAGTAPLDSSAAQHSLPTYYLRGYYKIDNERPVWQDSDAAPWAEVKANEPWVNRRIVKWGYVPFTHNAQNYYCLIDKGPRTGSHVNDVTFLCGDPESVQSLFIQNNWRPNIPMIGGGPELESSLRPRPAD